MSENAEIFISYSREDRATARRFADAFEAAGFPVWWDAALRAGEAFDLRIEDAIRGAGVVVVLWSEHSVRSRWVRAEATLGDRLKRLLPVRIGPCELPIIFELTHTLDLSHWDGTPGDEAWRAVTSQARRLIDRVSDSHDPEPPSDPQPSAPPETPARRPRSNLPTTRLELIGRDTELAAAHEALQCSAVVTISGPGGVGKSRLAQAVAAASVDQFDDGVWWVELAPVASQDLVPDAIARAAGLKLPGGLHDLVNELRDRKLLLVLDNCEHVIDAAANAVAAITAEASRVRVLTTSQERLNLPVEHLFRLQPLAVGESTQQASGALELFAARARALQPGFSLDEKSLPLVRDICRQLDGLPLAIELAAARLPVLGLNGLRDRLGDRLRVLGNTARGVPERQRTLRAALEWSHGLLADEEKTLFARLGVFAGGFDLEAAEMICADQSLESWQVVEIAGALLDKSLLSTDGADPPRYRLLETPRAFAVEQLNQGPDARAVRARHAALMRQRLLDAQEGQWTREGVALVGRVIRDIDNLRAALSWAAGSEGDPEMLIALAGTGSIVWSRAGAEAEGLAWCETALGVVDDKAQPGLEAELLVALGKLGHQSDATREIPALERAARLFAQIGDRKGEYIALETLAKKQVWRRDLGAAEATIAAAEALFQSDWPATMRIPLLQARTYLLEIQGQPADGEPLMHEAVALVRTIGDADEIDVAKLELAESFMVQGKVAEAAALRRELYDAGRRTGTGAVNLGNLAGAYAQIDQLDSALRFGRLAFSGLRNSHKLAVFLDHYAVLFCKLGQIEHGARLLGRSDANVRDSGFERELSEENAHRLALRTLESTLAPEQLRSLMAEGARLTDAAAIATALEAINPPAA